MGAFAVFFCFLVSTASAIPQLVNLEGKLNNNVGNPINASVPMTFAIYGAASGGSPLWSETHTSVQINNGIFDVLLGSQTSLNLPFDSDYWLAITVNGENMSQRVRIASAGYAFTAKNADKLNNLSSSAFQKRVSGNCSVGSSIRVINENGTVICENDDVGGADSDWIISGNNMYSNVSGNVGIGTTTPSAKLDVEVPIGGAATIGHSTCSATGDYAIATGYNTNASGQSSTAIGQSTTASGTISTAMGYSTTASGSRSTAMGGSTDASGLYSTAMGGATTASGYSSTAMGLYTTASGYASTAMGYYAKADADSSFAWGDNYCTSSSTRCNNTQMGVFAIYGGLCVAGTTACPAVANGNIRYDGSQSAYDIAEGFPTNKKLERGDVVVIVDNVTIGHTTKPYDSRVVGIISTSPNIVFNFDGDTNEYSSIGGLDNYTMPDDSAPLSLAGRVPVKVTNDNGNIEAGDMLTTSQTPGHAMKFTLLKFTGTETSQELADKLNENEERRNSILGKALEPCNNETCKIMVLITLQ